MTIVWEGQVSGTAERPCKLGTEASVQKPNCRSEQKDTLEPTAEAPNHLLSRGNFFTDTPAPKAKGTPNQSAYFAVRTKQPRKDIGPNNLDGQLAVSQIQSSYCHGFLRVLSTQTFMTPALFSHAVTKTPALQGVWGSSLIVELMGQQDSSVSKDVCQSPTTQVSSQNIHNRRREPSSTSSLMPISALWHTCAMDIHTHSSVSRF